jgi:major type 1 subunit fimbrin (pilin)
MMRKIALPLALLGAAMLAPPLYAADGSINVTGRVTESSCVVAADSKNITVDFGEQAGNSGLSGRGYGQSIKLLDCPSGANQVRIRFEGTAISDNNVINKEYVFAPDNQGQPGAAKNVGFGIYNEKGSVKDIKVNGDSEPYDLEYTGPGSSNQLYFGVWLRWLDKSKPIPLGEATGTIQFTILYN